MNNYIQFASKDTKHKKAVSYTNPNYYKREEYHKSESPVSPFMNKLTRSFFTERNSKADLIVKTRKADEPFIDEKPEIVK